MDSESFVHVLRIAVRDPAITQTIGYIAAPPGRKIPDDVKEMSSWYNNLNDNDKRMLSAILEKAVDSAMFGFLSVLDGTSAIEERHLKGRLKLSYVGAEETLLNSPDGPLLHELYS